ncbi:hypothetical protein ACFQ10_11645 [Streptomyces indonesiensis]
MQGERIPEGRSLRYESEGDHEYPQEGSHSRRVHGGRCHDRRRRRYRHGGHAAVPALILGIHHHTAAHPPNPATSKSASGQHKGSDGQEKGESEKKGENEQQGGQESEDGPGGHNDSGSQANHESEGNE